MDQYMDDGARLWLFNYVRKQHWRVAAWIDIDDLIQEGYFAYYDTLRRYPTAKEPQHIMSLFKLVLRSNIEDMVRKHTKQIDDARSDLVEIVSQQDAIDFSMLHALVIKAPKHIKDALALFLDDKAREELQKPFTQYASGARETFNERLCKLIGIDHNCIDVAGELKSYLT
jgi:DNA-directed RNA polymerase specialized sigma24 family protein